MDRDRDKVRKDFAAVVSMTAPKSAGGSRRTRAVGIAAMARASRWRYSLMNWGHDPTKEA
jgi:hypothetical protein